MSLEFLKIGKIKKSIEEETGAVLTNGNSVYLTESAVNGISRDYKERATEILEWLRKSIDNPDFVSYDREKREFTYVRFVYKENGFGVVLMKIVHFGRPTKLFLSDITRPSLGKINELIGDCKFVHCPRKA